VQKSRDDPPLSRATNDRNSHDEFAVEAPNGFSSDLGEDEVGRTMESLRIVLSFEAKSAPLLVHPHLLDPRQLVGAQEATRDRIEGPNERISEPEHGIVSVLALFDYHRLVEVREGKAEVKGGIGQDRRDGLLRPIEAVLRMEAHRPMLSWSSTWRELTHGLRLTK
jgi:hypothetical protein